MTPGARHAAAIEILEEILTGAPTEKTLTNWARSHRYAGSGDRAAIRDLVYDAVRCRLSHAAFGGADTARGIILGGVIERGDIPEHIFSGEGYSPDALGDEEVKYINSNDLTRDIQLDISAWLLPLLDESLGKDATKILTVLRARAPLFLRVNRLKTDRGSAMKALAAESIGTDVAPLSPTALQVTQNPRRVAGSSAFRDGLVEIQDVASQAVMDHIEPHFSGGRILDYCAGGGGKSLALAALKPSRIVAHDINAARMQDIPARAERAGVNIDVTSSEAIDKDEKFDLVLCDAPCSGSGAWRRQPDAKWALTPERLTELTEIQGNVLETASQFVGSSGLLAYVTCSLLNAENQEQIDAFLAKNPEWHQVSQRRFTPLDGGDGFFVAVLKRP